MSHPMLQLYAYTQLHYTKLINMRWFLVYTLVLLLQYRDGSNLIWNYFLNDTTFYQINIEDLSSMHIYGLCVCMCVSGIVHTFVKSSVGSC